MKERRSRITETGLLTRGVSYVGVDFSTGTSLACKFANILAWAVSHGIPIQSALAAGLAKGKTGTVLEKYLLRLRSVMRHYLISFGLRSVTPVAKRTSNRWSYRVRRVMEDLDSGMSLADALEARLHRDLPAFYIAGVRRAEEEGRLESALPILADQLAYPVSVARERMAAMAFLLNKVMIFGFVMVFVLTSVVPKIAEILSDLQVADSPGLFLRMVDVLTDYMPLGLLFLGLVILVYRWSLLRNLIVIRLPLLGRTCRRVAVGDMARGMAAFLEQGDDMITAARWNIHASRSGWVKSRLERFADSVAQGEPWFRAWSKVGLGRPMDRWLLQNAAAREDPVSGFSMIARWAFHDAETSLKRFVMWIDPIGSLLMTCVVGALAYFIFSGLTAAIYSIM